MTKRFSLALCAVALSAIMPGSTTGAAKATMVDVAESLYTKATPSSFDQRCKGADAELEVSGDRHTCKRSKLTTIVRFSNEAPREVTVFKKGLHKEVISQLKRKLGAADSVKSLGAMKMHFWFTKKANVSVGLQSSAESRATMVSYRSPS